MRSHELEQIRDAVETSFQQPPARRRLRHLVELFRGHDRPRAAALYARLRPWWGEGNRAWLFDNERDQPDQIGRAHVCTPVTNAPLVCRLLLEKQKNYKTST